MTRTEADLLLARKDFASSSPSDWTTPLPRTCCSLAYPVDLRFAPQGSCDPINAVVAFLLFPGQCVTYCVLNSCFPGVVSADSLLAVTGIRVSESGPLGFYRGRQGLCLNCPWYETPEKVFLPNEIGVL